MSDNEPSTDSTDQPDERLVKEEVSQPRRLPMPRKDENRTVSFELKWFLGALAVLIGGFWAFYSFNFSAAKRDFDGQLSREREQMKQSLTLVTANNNALLESMRRENDAKLQGQQTEQKAKLRELELTNRASVVSLEDLRRRDNEAFHHVIDGLRQQLSTSRSYLEISASGDFLSVNEMLIDERAGREKMAPGNFVNLKRLLLPDYVSVGWEKIEGVAFAQVEAYVKEKTIKLRPDEFSENHIFWHPLFTMWAKNTKDSVVAVGAAQLTQTEFIEFLQQANTSTVTLKKEQDGKTTESTEKITIDAKALGAMPVGFTAFSFVSYIVFSNVPLDPSAVRISAFSARSDALHFSATFENSGKKYEFEMLVLQDSKDIFLLYDVFSADNALDPVAREATDWLRAVRIVKKPQVK